MPTLSFKGKTFVQNHHLTVKYHQLVPEKKLSVGQKVSLHDNLIIHGDNLVALKSLLPTYAGKIDCIYIDPPYNTGNENWVYNDNINSPMIKEWLGKVVDKEDLTKHDKWLCMMMPRLKLLRDLLASSGVILISIDDHEAARLKVLMDEIFGEDNFIAQLVWEKGRKNDAKFYSVGHEYIFVYAQSLETLRDKKVVWREEKPGARDIQEEYIRLKSIHGENTDEIQKGIREFFKELPKTHPAKKHSRYGNVDKNGIWRDVDVSWPGGGGPSYDVIHPRTKKPCAVPDAGWRYSTPEKMQEMIDAGIVVFRDDHTEPPMRKSYLVRVSESDGIDEDEAEDDIGIQVSGSYFYRSAIQASNIISQIFGEKVFENPKDHEVIKRLIRYVTQNRKDIVVLDSFAGSGTTAHSVLDLNNEDGGNRRFILVEQENYANKITADRVRRIIKGVKNAKDEKLKKGFGGTFSYFEIGDPIEMESILQGKKLPSYKEFARYLYYTATGEEFDENSINEMNGFIGESKNYEVFAFYKPDLAWLKSNALTLEGLEALPEFHKKNRLIFAPAKYVDDRTLLEYRVEFCQLPYEIYRIHK
jgi:adenine-specific DNA-methyltransferase